MSSEEDDHIYGSSKGASYVRFKVSKKSFPMWKRKTESLAAQQGYAKILTATKTEDEIEDLYNAWEAEAVAATKLKLKKDYWKEKKNAKCHYCKLYDDASYALQHEREAWGHTKWPVQDVDTYMREVW